MRADAASAGWYTAANGKRYPRVQRLTVEGLLAGGERAEHPDYAPNLKYQKAKREKAAHPELFSNTPAEPEDE